MWQIAHVEWAVSVLMAFLVAARDGVPINSKCKDWRLYQDVDIPSPLGRLFPLPATLVAYVRTLGLQNILRGTDFRVGEVEVLLSYVAETDWGETPGFLWYDYTTGTFAAMPLHPAGRDNGKAYRDRVVLPASRRPHAEPLTVVDYFPRGAGFVADCLRPPATPLDDVPILDPNDRAAYSPAGSVRVGGSRGDG